MIRKEFKLSCREIRIKHTINPETGNEKTYVDLTWREVRQLFAEIGDFF
jgi:hypothetical protein